MDFSSGTHPWHSSSGMSDPYNPLASPVWRFRTHYPGAEYEIIPPESALPLVLHIAAEPISEMADSPPQYFYDPLLQVNVTPDGDIAVIVSMAQDPTPIQWEPTPEPRQTDAPKRYKDDKPHSDAVAKSNRDRAKERRDKPPKR